MSTVVKTVLVLLWLGFLACFGFLGLLWSVYIGSPLSLVVVLAADPARQAYSHSASVLSLIHI